MAHAAANPKFKWQRKLMAGGACEATAFSAFGFQSTCLCLPLGNYHNMQAIDEVQAGRRPAKVGREFISVEDLHGLIEMLEVVAGGLDASTAGGPLPQRLRALRRRNKIVLDG
jgi:endoglucanase